MKKKYIILSLFCFLTFIIFSIFLGTNCLKVVSRYLKGGNEYLEIWKDACIAYGQECSNVNNFFNLMKSYFNSLPYDFAYYIDHGTMAFSYLLPIITVISGIYFRKYIETLFPLKAYREKKLLSFMLKEMNMESLKYAISIYLSYILFMIIVCVFVVPTEPVHSFKYFLTDIFGRNFFYKNVLFYYFTEGTIRFFIVPYIYSFLGITFSFLFNKKRDLILEPLILYYGISFIAQFLIGININFVYIDPIIIMANQALEGYSSILLIISTLAIYIICIIIVFAKNKKIEIGVI